MKQWIQSWFYCRLPSTEVVACVILGCVDAAVCCIPIHVLSTPSHSPQHVHQPLLRRQGLFPLLPPCSYSPRRRRHSSLFSTSTSRRDHTTCRRPLPSTHLPILRAQMPPYPPRRQHGMPLHLSRQHITPCPRQREQSSLTQLSDSFHLQLNMVQQEQSLV